ncbi:hypothetical protein BD311DRAFT_818991 [Dichomitus squalens]|uniref:HMG box domain-containing protein n=1 Tax=Dichomitus squalens TaxID=114155 RepID=A0A4Q9MX97_9APHY|nr:hypothetical protein BD311DRAFT_818991 [Dichomitus squalens]
MAEALHSFPHPTSAEYEEKILYLVETQDRRVRHPPNAFICFRKWYNAYVRELGEAAGSKREHQNIVSTQAGRVWQELATVEDRLCWERIASDVRSLHQLLHPEWWTPEHQVMLKQKKKADRQEKAEKTGKAKMAKMAEKAEQIGKTRRVDREKPAHYPMSPYERDHRPFPADFATSSASTSSCGYFDSDDSNPSPPKTPSSTSLSSSCSSLQMPTYPHPRPGLVFPTVSDAMSWAAGDSISEFVPFCSHQPAWNATENQSPPNAPMQFSLSWWLSPNQPSCVPQTFPPPQDGVVWL